MRSEYRTRDSIRVDSIYLRDSIYTERVADTVYLYKYREQYKYVYIDKIDTVLKCDSIEVPYPVKSELSWWSRARIRIGEVAMAILIIAFVIKKGT